jgi:uncharacterized protein (TIGR03382 family)
VKNAFLPSFLLAAALSLAPPGCSAPAPDEHTQESAEAVVFQREATASNVPRDLLIAIAAVEGGLGMPALRDVAENVEVPAAGPLMLRRGQLDTLALGAVLSGESEWTLRKDSDAALRAAAMVLAKLGKASGADPAKPASYLAAVKELSGYSDEAHRTDYAHRVFATLARGGAFEGRDGKPVALEGHELPLSLTVDVSLELRTLAGAQYAGAQYFPIPAAKQADKMAKGRAGNTIQYIVIHDTEGGWDGSVATLQNDPGKSAEYIIDIDGRVGQFVLEQDTAYHAGNLFYNQRSIGIEHVGYTTKPFPTKQYQASAALVKHLATKYKVPLNRTHIIGHDQVPNGDKIPKDSAPCAESPLACRSGSNYGGAGVHSDPGVWEWPRLMYLLGATAKTNDVTPRWNCSSDKGFAFRSNAGQVEVRECASCTEGAPSSDDLCVQKAVPTGPTAPGADSDAGVDPAPENPPSPNGNTTRGPGTTPSKPGASGSTPPATSNRPDDAAGSSCNSSSSTGPLPGSWAALLLVLGWCIRRRPHA